MNEFQYEHKYLQSIKYLEESYKGEYNCADILYFLNKNGICQTKYLRYDKNKNYTPACIFNAERYKNSFLKLPESIDKYLSDFDLVIYHDNSLITSHNVF